MRIDSEPAFFPSLVLKYKEEIAWCYRLGYCDEEQRDHLLEYLDDVVEKSSLNHRKAHEVRMAQLKYEQSLMREKKLSFDMIKQIFSGK